MDPSQVLQLLQTQASNTTLLLNFQPPMQAAVSQAAQQPQRGPASVMEDCQRFLHGKCTHGSECKFRHVEQSGCKLKALESKMCTICKKKGREPGRRCKQEACGPCCRKSTTPCQACQTKDKRGESKPAGVKREQEDEGRRPEPSPSPDRRRIHERESSDSPYRR